MCHKCNIYYGLNSSHFFLCLVKGWSIQQLIWYILVFRVVIHSFDTKKTQSGVNKKDKIMHSQGGKGIFSQFKKYLQEFIEENQKRC